MKDFENVEKYAVYQDFNVGDHDNGYILTIGQYDGTAGYCLVTNFVIKIACPSGLVWGKIINATQYFLYK